jgi:hypothetical protein
MTEATTTLTRADGRLMLQNITHALSPTHTDVASAMAEIFTGSQ